MQADAACNEPGSDRSCASTSATATARSELERARRRPGVPAVAREAKRVLCPSCRRQLERGASYCGSCGTPLNGAGAPLELVLADATRVPRGGAR